jgi:hypothetical protein
MWNLQENGWDPALVIHKESRMAWPLHSGPALSTGLSPDFSTAPEADDVDGPPRSRFITR